jgi:outer membrane protein assembly factor BamB
MKKLTTLFVIVLCLTGCTVEHGPGKPVKVVRGMVASTGRFSHGPFGLATTGWPKAHGDIRNSGRGSGSGARGHIKWVVLQPFGDCSPTIAKDGTIYMSGTDGYLYALEPTTGAGKWRVLIDGGYFPSLTNPAISSQGIVYVNGNQTLYAIDGASGDRLWKYDINNSIAPSPTISKDGFVITCLRDRIIALNGVTGKLVWASSIGGVFVQTPAIGRDGAVIAEAGNCLYALDGATGAVKWKAVLPAQITSSPSISTDGTVYIGSDSGFLHAFNETTGIEKWSIPLINTFPVLPIDVTPAIARDGTVYVQVGSILHALNGTTGHVIWDCADLGEENSSVSPSIAGDGTIYEGSFFRLKAIDPSTRNVRWTASVEISMHSKQNIAIGPTGTIYANIGDGLCAVD